MLPEARHLVLNLLLGTAHRRLSAREAVASCALFGIRENNVRVALARLAAAGMIESIERGQYRLGPQAAGLAGDVSNWRDVEARVRDWDGGWIAVHVGALSRSDRALRRARERALGLLGLRELDGGLFVRPDNLAGGVEAVRERLARLGLGAEAAVFVAHSLDDERKRRAERLWDAATLDRGYRETRATLDAWLARWSAGAPALALEAAARESFVLGNDAIRQLVFDPLLPAPLVDVDARRAFVDAVRRFDGIGHSIWRRFLLGAAGGLVRPQRALASAMPAAPSRAKRAFPTSASKLETT
ncbi:MAG: PaaX family transcriptional regulator C-terminal domain-containing protein [Burkholderiaceae bacterium]|nr:PaaX family transcriptional regulator C-terminal domain-containing protein [Burkholderiaceae bacterium]